MSAIFRIPLAVAGRHSGDLVALDDLDLPLLIEHCGVGLARGVGVLEGRSRDGRPVDVQWLANAAPSAVAPERRGTLLLAGAAARQRSAQLDLLVSASAPDGPAARRGSRAEAVEIEQSPDTLEIRVEDRPFLTYHYNTDDAEVPRPYFHPVVGPSGKTITQMGEIPGKKEAHHWHTALWISHQKFSDGNNWQIGPQFSRMQHVKFDHIESGPLAGRFIEELRWLDFKGERSLLDEVRTVTVYRRPAERRLLDVEIVLTARDRAITLEKTPYHMIAVRVLDAMLPKNGGAITNSEGKANPDDGEPAKWIDISGKLDGEPQGVALFNHPENFHHPTPCLQFAGQTIGLAPTHQEPHTIEPGTSLRLRYRVLVHSGDVAAGQVAHEYAAYEQPARVRVDGPVPLSGY